MNQWDFDKIQETQQAAMRRAKDNFDRATYESAERTLKNARNALWETQRSCQHTYVSEGSWGPRDWERCTKCGHLHDY